MYKLALTRCLIGRSHMKPEGYRIKAILFDFDGTLTQPGALDFKSVRKALGCPANQPVLEFIQTIEDPQTRQDTLERLNHFETRAASSSRPNGHAQSLVQWIKQQRLKVGIITRNSRASVMRALENFDVLAANDFDLMITRDDAVAPKPSGEGIVWACRQLAIGTEEILMVGDFMFDTQAGQAAGALTALLDPDGSPQLQDIACSFRIESLEDLIPIIQAGLPLPAGKLPNALLGAYLREFKIDDPSVLIKPGVGEDVAAIDAADTEVLVLKSDPITFATNGLGQYAVRVNANDVATAGARPRWFLATILLPCDTTPSQAYKIMLELTNECRRGGIALCGGHTEITDTVKRPVVSGMMVGTVRRRDLIDKKKMRTGDRVLITKQVAVEGTAIVARQFKERLQYHGLNAEEIAAGSDLLDGISVVKEARLAARDHLATAIHDVTEGGLATALEELSVAGQCKIAVEKDRIPIYDLSRKMCAALGLDPLGLIGSGSLLICCRPTDCARLIDRLQDQGIEVTEIGQVLEAGTGVIASNKGVPCPWPKFEVDEITKLFY